MFRFWCIFSLHEESRILGSVTQTSEDWPLKVENPWRSGDKTGGNVVQHLSTEACGNLSWQSNTPLAPFGAGLCKFLYS